MQTKRSANSLKEKQRQEREALILQVAEDVLREKGYHETSIDEIATRVGVAKGTIYLHFPSKEDLVVAIFSRDIQRFLQGIDAAVACQTTNRARLEGILNFLYSGFSRRAQLLYAMYNNADLRKLFTEKGSCLHDLWDEFAVRIGALLDAGKQTGEFDESIPTDVMLSAFLSLLSPRSYERLLGSGQINAEELVRYLGRIYFGGIAAKK